LSHLTFSDLKACRPVSRLFLEAIEAYERFKDCQLLSITDGKRRFLGDLGELEPNFLKAGNLIHSTWFDIRNIHINVYFVQEVLLHIPGYVLKNASFVSLSYEEDLENDGSNEPAPDIFWNMSMYWILWSAEQISHLQLDLRLLMMDLDDLVFSVVIRDNLKNVKNLDIFGWPQKKFGETTYSIYPQFTPNLIKNIDRLASALHCLESLHFPVSVLSSNDQNEEFTIVVAPNLEVESLLQRSRESLRELSLHLGMWDKLPPVTLPHLRRFSATVSNGTQQDSLKNFLVANQGNNSLAELDVAVRRRYVFGSNLFDVIRRQYSPYLKKLHLQAYTFGDVEQNEVVKVDWTFLREMKCLRDFQLARPYTPVRPNWVFQWNYGNGTFLLESLPKCQLERLSLRGIGIKSGGFWRNGVVVNDMEPELPFKLDLLVGGFRNLKRLSLRYCPDAVDDDIMRVIIREMTSLEEFEVSHCSGLTDAGIAGTSEDGSDSIRNLKCEWNF